MCRKLLTNARRRLVPGDADLRPSADQIGKGEAVDEISCGTPQWQNADHLPLRGHLRRTESIAPAEPFLDPTE